MKTFISFLIVGIVTEFAILLWLVDGICNH
jgi:hypothetical protein